MLCASAIYRLAEEEESRDLVRMHGGLEPLVELLQEPENQSNKVSAIFFFNFNIKNGTIFCVNSGMDKKTLGLEECFFPFLS